MQRKMNHNFLLISGLIISVLSMFGCTEQGIDDRSAVPTEKMLSDSSLLEMSASEIKPFLSSGRVSVERYMRVLLQHTKGYTPGLNAFIHLDDQAVIAAAKEADKKRSSNQQLGALFGIPISLKDLIVTQGTPTTFGTRTFAGFVPDKNAPVVTRLLAADAIIFGKNNAQEWAYGSNGYNSHYGQQLNPYDPTRIAGGSSGGGAAAVSARMLPLAIGSDTAASIRVPAAYTGLYGFRPSMQRYDNAGVAPIAPSLDTIGPLARSIDDLILIDGVLADDPGTVTEIKLADLRLGVPNSLFYADCSVEVQAAFQSVLSRLRKAGVTLVEADLPQVRELTDAGLYAILFYETYPAVTKFLSEWGDGTKIETLHANLGWDVKAIWDDLVVPGAAHKTSKADYLHALNVLRPQLQQRYHEYFSEHNVSAMIFPATATVAPAAKPENPQGLLVDGKPASIYLNDQNSGPGALAGQPGVVIPVSMTQDNLPIAVSLDGKRDQDLELLSTAKAIGSLLTPLASPQKLAQQRLLTLQVVK